MPTFPNVDAQLAALEDVIAALSGLGEDIIGLYDDSLSFTENALNIVELTPGLVDDAVDDLGLNFTQDLSEVAPLLVAFFEELELTIEDVIVEIDLFITDLFLLFEAVEEIDLLPEDPTLLFLVAMEDTESQIPELIGLFLEELEIPLGEFPFDLDGFIPPIVPGVDLKGTPDPDLLLGTLLGNDVLRGIGGDDLLIGFGGADFLIGREGNDILVGGFGNDTLIGGTGDDVLVGGFGDDKFRMLANSDTDLIVDFGNGDDLIHIRAFNLANGFADVNIQDDGTDSLVTFNGDSTVVVVLNYVGLVESDFFI